MKVDALHSIPAEAAETAAGQRLSVRVEGLRLDAQVGVYASEHGRTQPLEISLQAEVEEASAAPGSDLTQAVNYAAMAETVRQVVAARHHELLEDLAQTLTDTLFQDVRVKRLRLTIDKPDALDDARSVGVTYERWR